MKKFCLLLVVISFALSGYTKPFDYARDGFPPLQPLQPKHQKTPQKISSLNLITKAEKSILGQTYENQHIDVRLNRLEKTVFNRKFSGETSAQRLARLENSVFSKTFSDADDSRIQRLLAATTAQKTSGNYDNNTLMQRLNTGLQIGGIILMVLAMIL